MVPSLVSTSALLARQRRAGDQPCEREGIAQELLQALARSLESGEAPEGITSLRRGQRRGPRLGRRSALPRLRLVERGAGGAVAEHEAFGQRVRRQPVGAV